VIALADVKRRPVTLRRHRPPEVFGKEDEDWRNQLLECPKAYARSIKTAGGNSAGAGGVQYNLGSQKWGEKEPKRSHAKGGSIKQRKRSKAINE